MNSNNNNKGLQENNQQRPARHPILDRLENNDYDLNGQSLDYEPNLEFDDTDLKQEIEEELEELKLNYELRFEQADNQSTSDETAQLDEHNSEDDSEAFMDQFESQLYLNQPQTPTYLESPQELMEENFEEAFKSTLFELDEQLQSGANAKSNQNCNKLLGRPNSSKLNSFLRQATGGLYVNRNSLLNQSGKDLQLNEDEQFDDNDDFSDIAQHNCVEVAGDDLFGRRIITIYACRLPNEHRMHHLRLLKYIMYTLDRYVENDYCVVYFHHGLNSHNKPKLNFLYQAYKASTLR